MAISKNKSFVSTKSKIEPPEPPKFPHKESLELKTINIFKMEKRENHRGCLVGMKIFNTTISGESPYIYAGDSVSNKHVSSVILFPICPICGKEINQPITGTTVVETIHF